MSWLEWSPYSDEPRSLRGHERPRQPRFQRTHTRQKVQNFGVPCLWEMDYPEKPEYDHY